jgi:ribosomal protein S18 acetylase RimI-like enzyme
VYASTRTEEVGRVEAWSEADRESFLRHQFELQHREYRRLHPRASYEVVLVDGEPAGRLYVRDDPDAVHIMDIALLPGFRGSGVGGALLAELFDLAAARGVVVRIWVERENRALSLYRRLGFERVGEHGVYVLMEARPPAAGVS